MIEVYMQGFIQGREDFITYFWTPQLLQANTHTCMYPIRTRGDHKDEMHV